MKTPTKALVDIKLTGDRVTKTQNLNHPAALFSSYTT